MLNMIAFSFCGEGHLALFGMSVLRCQWIQWWVRFLSSHWTLQVKTNNILLC